MISFIDNVCKSLWNSALVQVPLSCTTCKVKDRDTTHIQGVALVKVPLPCTTCKVKDRDSTPIQGVALVKAPFACTSYKVKDRDMYRVLPWSKCLTKSRIDTGDERTLW